MRRLSVFLLATLVSCGATFSWTPPTTYTDGSPLIVAGTRLWCGNQSGPYGFLADVPTPATSHEATPNGTYCVATVYDAAGAESVFSNEVQVAQAGQPPEQVQDVNVSFQPQQESPNVTTIAHAFDATTVNETTTSTTFVASTVTLASGNFVAGKKYLLVVTAQVSSSAGFPKTRVVHGTTEFDGSLNDQDTGGVNRGTFLWFIVWTAISGEAVTLEFAVDNAANTANLDQASLFAMNLSDDLAENTDWFFNEVATDLALTTTFQAGAAVTFTPAAGQDWLILSFSNIDPSINSRAMTTRISRSGEVASTLPTASVEATSAAAAITGMVFGLARVFNLGAASNTFTEESASVGGNAHTRLHSAIFALNLNKFAQHANAYTEASVALSTTDYATELQTIDITPAVAGDVWFGAYWGFDFNSTFREAEFRIQVDQADDPATQTTDNYQFHHGGDVADIEPLNFSSLSNLSAATHTIDLDASADSTTDTPAGVERTLWAVTMELAAAGGRTTKNTRAWTLGTNVGMGHRM